MQSTEQHRPHGYRNFLTRFITSKSPQISEILNLIKIKALAFENTQSLTLRQCLILTFYLVVILLCDQ